MPLIDNFPLARLLPGLLEGGVRRQHPMITIIQILIGALCCLVFILVARQAGLKREAIIYAVALVVAASIYGGFAALAGALTWLAIEVGGLVLFSLVSLLGLRTSMWFLVLGWAAHTVWDVFLHKVVNVGFVPEWYPGMCLGFDLVLAGYIGMCVRGGRWVAQAA